MIRAVNEAGMALIKQFEGLRLDAYQDVAGVWTIGYGHIRGVSAGMHITATQAGTALADDVHGANQVVLGETWTLPFSTSNNQFAAMVALCFNIGSLNFRASSVLRLHRGNNPLAAADAFLLWNKAHVQGRLQVVDGLTRRREAERALYQRPDEETA